MKYYVQLSSGGLLASEVTAYWFEDLKTGCFFWTKTTVAMKVLFRNGFVLRVDEEQDIEAVRVAISNQWKLVP